jgi:hypothetical protein
MPPIPALARKAKHRRDAMRAALAGQRLDPNQVKIVVKEHDALFAKSIALMHESEKVFSHADDVAGNRVLTVVERRLDQLTSQSEPLDSRAQKLRAHPQVRAAILERERKAEAQS